MKFEDLTTEQKEKIIACKTPEELIELAKDEGYELTDAQLESISGGGWSSPSCGDDTAWTYVC
ncbi:MAG: Nif11-like leader peptide family natural product precursor [Eggerthellaceae bacterium]|nr:Nif11-like leader peptide family natural product precursor [Eggerthellaceae bacterium]